MNLAHFLLNLSALPWETLLLLAVLVVVLATSLKSLLTFVLSLIRVRKSSMTLTPCLKNSAEFLETLSLILKSQYAKEPPKSELENLTSQNNSQLQKLIHEVKEVINNEEH